MSDDDYQRARYGAYLQERRSLVELENAHSQAFDKYLLTIASGTFALTLTVMTTFMDVSSLNHVGRLLAGWVLVTACILFVLLSFLTSQWAYRRQVDIVKVTLLDDGPDERNVWGLVTVSLNLAAILGFIAGITCLFLFVSANL